MNIEKLTKALEENLCVVVKFSAKWCGPCKNKEFLNEYNTILKKYSFDSNFKFISIDVDENDDICKNERFEVKNIPHIKVFLGGENIKEITGINLKTLSEVLDKVNEKIKEVE